MQISVESVQQREDPYQLFLDSLKSDETIRKYKKALDRFLKLIPNKLYENAKVKIPKDKSPEEHAKCFVMLANKDSILAQNIIASFIKEEKKLVEEGKLNPNTLPNHIKPIKALLDANAVAIHWKSLYRLYPRQKVTKDRAYTREELQKMIEASPDITDKLIIELFSSGGFRVEAWDYFRWKDIILFKNKDGTYRGAALLVYGDDPESYWTFVTPEACQTLEHYREVWKSKIGRYPRPEQPLVRTVKFPIVKRLNAMGVKKRIKKIVKKIGLRPTLQEGQRRHEVPLDHGFRKYFNTMMRRAKVNFLDKEDMMGHSTGLEKHYERYNEEDFERFTEYQKAIPFLTISDQERLRLKNQKLEEEKTELQKMNNENLKLKLDLDDIKLEVAKVKKRQEIAENFKKKQ